MIGGRIAFVPAGDSKIEFVAASAGDFNLIGAGAAGTVRLHSAAVPGPLKSQTDQTVEPHNATTIATAAPPNIFCGSSLGGKRR